jgi:phosphoheptose isomerase
VLSHAFRFRPLLRQDADGNLLSTLHAHFLDYWLMSHVQSSIDLVLKTIESLRPLERNILKAADVMQECLRKGGKLMACGNGGSAADVSDFTAEYVCRFMDDRPPFPAINLTSDGGLLAAIGNDYEFEEIFSRQVRAFGKRGDVLIVASTSGRSKNIVRALEESQRLGLESVALLGKDGGAAKGLATVELIVPAAMTARTQEAHKVLFHIICELVDPLLKG